MTKPDASVYRDAVIAFLTTTDAVKLSAVEAVLTGAGLTPRVFDRAMSGLYARAVPLRLMLEESEVPTARMAMRAAGFAEAGDGDWDLRRSAS